MMEGAGTLARVIGRVTVFGSVPVGLLQAWWPKTALLWNFPGWTLSVEAFFYLSFPFLAIWLVSRFRTTRALLTAIVLLWLISQVAPILYLALDPEYLGYSSPAWSGMFSSSFDGFWMRLLRFNPLLHLPEFLIGMCLGKLFLMRPATGGGFVAPAALLTLCAVLVCSPLFPFPMLHNGLLAPIVCILIYALASGGGALGRLLFDKAVSVGRRSQLQHIHPSGTRMARIQLYHRRGTRSRHSRFSWIPDRPDRDLGSGVAIHRDTWPRDAQKASRRTTERGNRPCPVRYLDYPANMSGPTGSEWRPGLRRSLE